MYLIIVAGSLPLSHNAQHSTSIAISVQILSGLIVASAALPPAATKAPTALELNE